MFSSSPVHWHVPFKNPNVHTNSRPQILYSRPFIAFKTDLHSSLITLIFHPIIHACIQFTYDNNDTNLLLFYDVNKFSQKQPNSNSNHQPHLRSCLWKPLTDYCDHAESKVVLDRAIPKIKSNLRNESAECRNIQ